MIENLKNIKTFEKFSEDNLRELADFIVTKDYAAGDTIFREGDPGEASYIIEKGRVEVQKQGKLLGLFSEGDMFGEMTLYEGAPRSATAEAKTDTTL